MSDTAVKCSKCNQGMLLIEVNPDGDNENGTSYIEQPCSLCGGKGFMTKSELITAPVDKRLEPENFLPIPLTGAFRVYIDGKLYDRKMSSRQLLKLAQKVLEVGLETQQFERERDEASGNQA